MKHCAFFFAFIIGVTGCSTKQPVAYSSDNFELIELAEGVFGCIHKIGGKAICNVGIIDNGKETLIFDSFLTPSVAKELLDVVEIYNLSPIKYVVNSHSHNDHIRGNQVFSPGVKIISTSRTAELIEEWEPVNMISEKQYAPKRFMHFDSLYNTYEGDTTTREYLKILIWRPYFETLAESHKVVKTRLPDTFVDTLQYFNGPKRSVQIISKGEGHTESDLMMYLPDDEILFTGDLVFNGYHPYLSDGSIPGLKNQLNFMDSLPVTIVVPGHGQVGSEKIIKTMREYVILMENLVAEIHSQGLTIEDSKRIDIPEPYKDWWFDQFFLSNLRFAFGTLDK